MESTPIARVCEYSPMQALVVAPDAALEDVIDELANARSRYAIFLAAEEGRFKGAVSNSDLLDWARLQFDLLPDESRLPKSKVRRLLAAQQIGDLAGPESSDMSVRLEDTLALALRKMSAYALEDIAVLDKNGRIVNDLRLSEVLAFALQIRRGAVG